MHHQPRPDDIFHILAGVLDGPGQWQALPALAEVDSALAQQVLEEAGKFVASEVAPLQGVGDQAGCRWDAGQVHTPPGFRAAYQAFWQAGWPALAADTAHSGQGLPLALELALYEMLSGANHGWTMAPGLLSGAYDCLRHHATPEVQALFLDKIASGEWLATMCLTEPQAGSDLGLVRTRAEALADGRFALHGSKIFISGGEHDLSDNIVHLVLARLPDAPPGPKGLSLFVAPKWLPDGSRNAVHCDRIEEKMGLHGSPTCAMRFEGALAWPVGEPHRGLAAMFVMMNAARLHVALQGIGLLDAAHQKAWAYAQERRQMRAPGARETSPIAHHPAVQRTLDTQRIWVDAGRVLAYRTAIELDVARHHPDAARRDVAQRWCSLTTPIMKAAFTRQAFHGASDCLQVFGGHGYVREWGIEQIVRDARVTMIYEGTNEIQALDLLQRKVLPDAGAALEAVLRELAAEAGDDAAWHTATDRLLTLTRRLAAQAATAPALAAWVADDFLRACALLLLRWAGARLAQRVDASAPRWQGPLTALRLDVWPEFEMRLAMIEQRMWAQATRPAPCAEPIA